MKSKATLMIAGLGLLAALFFLLVEQPRHARETERAAASERLTAVRPEEVHAVSILRPDVALAGVREGGGWRIVSPVSDGADDGAFNMLVVSTCGAAVERRLEADERALAEYGLDAPEAELRFEAADGKKLLELRIGDLNPSKSHCYALPGDGREVVLLPSGVRRYAMRSLFEFRDKRILDIDLADVVGIEIEGRSGPVAWTAGEDGRWFTLQSSDTVRGNKTALENVVRRLRGLRARDIPFEENGAAPRVEERAGSIRLSTRGDSAGITLTFAEPRGDQCLVVSSHTGRAALVDTAVTAAFRMTLEDFRDKRIFWFDEAAVAKVEWQTPGFARTIVRKDGLWSYTNPAFGKIETETARHLLAALALAEFSVVIETRVPAPAGHGFDAPALRIRLFDAADRPIDDAVFGSLARDGVSRYVWSRSTRSVSTIGHVSASSLDDALSDFAGP